jgi:2',3'-cyclic-nucleotide 2'-phosphodiesterase (5'-nucleotidase family)
MNRKTFCITSALFMLSVVSMLFAFTLLSACKPSYRVAEISGIIVPMNASYDVPPHEKMQGLVNSYKTKLDEEMNIVIGKSIRFMDYRRPESLLTNLTSDVMKAYGDEHLPDGADIAVMNVHGHRASLPKGDVTVGNLYEIYSFDNAITFLKVKGSDLNKIFDAYARIGGGRHLKQRAARDRRG